MSKEALIKLGDVLYPKTVNLSKWHVDKAVQIPVRQALVPIPLYPSSTRNQQHRARYPVSKRWPALVTLLMTLFAAVSINASQSVSIAWNPSTDSSTAGYIVYAGNSPTNFTAQLNVGTNTTVTITGLTGGTTNYFAVAGYNAANLVGAISSSISYIVPGLLVMTPNPGTYPKITFPTAVGHWYEIQASTNLLTWSNILQTATATTNAWVSYADPQAGSFSKRFYRLVMH